MNHRFGAAGEFTVGLEEELLLVDPETLQLDHGAERVLERIGLAEPRAGHEAFQASIEVRSEPRASAAEAAAEIAEGRAAVIDAGGTPRPG